MTEHDDVLFSSAACTPTATKTTVGADRAQQHACPTCGGGSNASREQVDVLLTALKLLAQMATAMSNSSTTTETTPQAQQDREQECVREFKELQKHWKLEETAVPILIQQFQAWQSRVCTLQRDNDVLQTELLQWQQEYVAVQEQRDIALQHVQDYQMRVQQLERALEQSTRRTQQLKRCIKSYVQQVQCKEQVATLQSQQSMALQLQAHEYWLHHVVASKSRQAQSQIQQQQLSQQQQQQQNDREDSSCHCDSVDSKQTATTTTNSTSTTSERDPISCFRPSAASSSTTTLPPPRLLFLQQQQQQTTSSSSSQDSEDVDDTAVVTDSSHNLDFSQDSSLSMSFSSSTTSSTSTASATTPSLSQNAVVVSELAAPTLNEAEDTRISFWEAQQQQQALLLEHQRRQADHSVYTLHFAVGQALGIKVSSLPVQDLPTLKQPQSTSQRRHWQQRQQQQEQSQSKSTSRKRGLLTDIFLQADGNETERSCTLTGKMDPLLGNLKSNSPDGMTTLDDNNENLSMQPRLAFVVSGFSATTNTGPKPPLGARIIAVNGTSVEEDGYSLPLVIDLLQRAQNGQWMTETASTTFNITFRNDVLTKRQRDGLPTMPFLQTTTTSSSGLQKESTVGEEQDQEQQSPGTQENAAKSFFLKITGQAPASLPRKRNDSSDSCCNKDDLSTARHGITEDLSGKVMEPDNEGSDCDAVIADVDPRVQDKTSNNNPNVNKGRGLSFPFWKNEDKNHKGIKDVGDADTEDCTDSESETAPSLSSNDSPASPMHKMSTTGPAFQITPFWKSANKTTASSSSSQVKESKDKNSMASTRHDDDNDNDNFLTSCNTETVTANVNGDNDNDYVSKESTTVTASASSTTGTFHLTSFWKQNTKIGATTTIASPEKQLTLKMSTTTAKAENDLGNPLCSSGGGNEPSAPLETKKSHDTSTNDQDCGIVLSKQDTAAATGNNNNNSPNSKDGVETFKSSVRNVGKIFSNPFQSSNNNKLKLQQ